MPVVKVYVNGGSVARSGRTPRVPPKRGDSAGWSQGAARRNSVFLQSVDLPALDGRPWSLTLTLPAGSLRDPVEPPDSAEFHRLLRAYLERLRRAGAIRWHWVIEFTKRRTPHLHMAVWMPENADSLALFLAHWLQLTSNAGWPASVKSQHGAPLDDAGWLQYMAKHGARGVRMYQRTRDALPESWRAKPGRMWGYGGSWPSAEDRAPMEWLTDQRGMWAYRRLLRAWAVNQARSTSNVRLRGRYIRQARSMLRCGDPRLSPVRPASLWIPEDVQLELLLLLPRLGHPIRQR